MNVNSCICCGSGDMVEGNMHSTGLIRFRPSSAKFMTFRTADVTVTARMCANCGAVSLVGDVEKLNALTKPDHESQRVAAAAHQAT